MQRRFSISLPMVFGLLALAPLLTVSAGAAPGQNGIVVSGRCKKSVPRDRVSVRFTAVHQSASSKEAHALVQKKYESFRQGASALRLKDFEIETTEVSLDPRIEWVNGKNVNKGFEGRATLLITTSSIDRVGELYDVAGKAGIQNFGALNTFVSDAVYKVVYQDCLKSALLDARSKASELASAGKKVLGDLMYANEAGPAAASPIFMTAMADSGMGESAKMRGGAPIGIDAGNGNIEVQITAMFEIR